VISQLQRQDYETEGVVLIEQAFSPQWVARLTTAFDRLQERIRAGLPLPHCGDPGVRDADGDFDARTGRAHLRNAAPHDSDVRAWAVESPAADLVASLLGVSTVQLWYDLWFCKEAGGGIEAATPWHHDSVGHCFEGPHIPSLWIALSDVGPDDAPLLTLPGSHRDPRLFPPPYRPGKEHWPLAEGYTPIEVMHAEVAVQTSRVQTWTVRAGDCLLIHPQTWPFSPGLTRSTGITALRICCRSALVRPSTSCLRWYDQVHETLLRRYASRTSACDDRG
jgi:ectoine hydroxylase-related dioxygenase (phytanoyl-CoA dioxygenase family)